MRTLHGNGSCAFRPQVIVERCISCCAASTPVATEIAWEITSGAGVNILIIDSGRDQNHEDLGDVGSMTCVGGDPWDRYGHGTFVTGIVKASNNSVGVIGGAYNAQVFTERDGDADPDPSGTACGVEWGRAHGVFVVN
ncbi:MAG TPA: S8 family serine peptidase, partial [Gemmatimonadales bacterium]